MAERFGSMQLRGRGYEALFFLGGMLSLALKPTLRGALEFDHQWGKRKIRQRDIEQLRKMGLLRSRGTGADAILQLTSLGQEALEGGRDPEQAWSRSWDGDWRLLVFDLPQREAGTRVRFWRWLRSQHFGRLQGSVWITPDDKQGLREVVEEAGFSPEMCVLFTGGLEEDRDPKQIAASAWDFERINGSYRAYLDFAASAGKGAAAKGDLAELLAKDRERWWGAVQIDPLLPDELLPRGYQGKRAWKARKAFHQRLVELLR